MAEQYQREAAEKEAQARVHLGRIAKSIEEDKKAHEKSVRRTELLEGALEANISAGLLSEAEPEPPTPAVDPRAISGLWRAFGTFGNDGGQTEEFLLLQVAADGTVTGMVDSDGDGVWSEEDCRIANGFLDGTACSIRFDQVYDDSPSDEGERTGSDKTRWEAVYDASRGMFVNGEWSTATGSAGKFECERTTEDKMLNRTRGAQAQPKLFDPVEISGLWRAFGTFGNDGGQTEEFLLLQVAADGTVTGMVDSDGDGVWSEEDCRIANGFLDGTACSIRFDQVYDDSPSDEGERTGSDKTRWEAVYDASRGMFVNGEWSTATGSAGKFECERTTEDKMLNRTRGAQAQQG